MYVEGIRDGNYSTIHDANENTTDGDTVFIYKGKYEYDVQDKVIPIKNRINLIGESRDETIIIDTSNHLGHELIQY